jgi:hypothetical protein
MGAIFSSAFALSSRFIFIFIYFVGRGVVLCTRPGIYLTKYTTHLQQAASTKGRRAWAKHL